MFYHCLRKTIVSQGPFVYQKTINLYFEIGSKDCLFLFGKLSKKYNSNTFVDCSASHLFKKNNSFVTLCLSKKYKPPFQDWSQGFLVPIWKIVKKLQL